MKSLSMFVAAMGIAGGIALSAQAETLTWNGARGARWDADAANWLDAGNNPAAWRDGADAVFPAGAFVEVRDSVRPASITFTGNGATLVGAGRIVLPGDLTASVAGTTNSVVVKLVGDATFTKRGAGAVAVSFAKGSALAAEGTLLVAGSRSANLRTTAAGGTVEWLGKGTAAANLLANGSFEATTASGNYAYMNGTGAGDGSFQDVEGTAVTPWKVSGQVVLANSAGVKTWCGAASIVGTGVPDGAQLCILQRFGSIMQEVSVAEDGWYDLSLTYYKRGSNYDDHRVTVFVDDVTVASLLSNMIQAFQVDFATGPVWLPAGTHRVRLAGEGWTGDVASFVDDIRLSPPTAGTAPQSAVQAANAVSGNWSSASLWADGTAPSAGGSAAASLFFPLLDGLASANDLSGTFLFNSLHFGGVASGEAAALSGNALSSRRDGSYHGYLSLDTPGEMAIANALTVNSNLLVETEGDLTLSGSLGPALAEGACLQKTGAGTLTLAGSIGSVENVQVLEGTAEVRTHSSAMRYVVKPSTNVTAVLAFNFAADTTVSRYINVHGAGLPVVRVRTDAGRRVRLENTLNTYGPQVQVDVGEGDVLDVNRIIQATWREPYSSTSLLKTGSGTLAVRYAGTVPTMTSSTEGNIGSLRGVVTVREGFVEFASDDFGYQSGLTNIYTGAVFPASSDGTLGHTTDTPLMLGDARTPAGATAGVKTYLAPTCSSRTYVATPYPGKVVVGAETNGIYQMGAVVLRRGDLTLGGPAGDVADVDVMLTDVELDGVAAATVSREGNVRTILNGASYPSGLTLVSDRMLEVGFRRSLAVSIGNLALSGGWQVSFDAAGNDSISAGALTLGPTEITLWDDANEAAFAQPGVYTLLRYGTLSGSVASLAVADACKVPGYGYAIADDGNGAITLTITTAADNPVYTWTAPSGGAWGDAANWDHPTAPDGAAAQAVLGLVPQAAATVTLADPVTVNALTLYNANGYTVAGEPLRFDGDAPFILASAGDHVIQSAVTNLAATPISVQSTSQGRVRFAGDVNGDLSVERGGVALAEGMNLNGNITVTGATLTVESGAGIGGTATLGEDARLVAGGALVLDSLAGADATAEIVANGPLTLGAANSSFGGTVSGTGPLVKTGAGALALNGLSFTHSGGTFVNAGALAVGATLLPDVTRIADGATLKSSGMHGLTGRYWGYFTESTRASFADRIYSRADFETMLSGLTYRGKFAMPLATCLSIGDTRENAFPSAFGSQNYWAAVYTATLLAPETGLYSFSCLADDQVIFLIDDAKVLSVRSAGTTAYGGRHLAKGFHTLCLGLFEVSGNAYADINVKQPGESAYKPLPAAWLFPDAGAEELAGMGTVAADAGTVTTVGTGGEAGFNGDFAGSFAAADGGLVQKIGGVLAARYVSGDVAAAGGELFLYGGDAFGTVRATDGGTVSLFGGTIRNLSGDGRAAFGHVYTVPRINGDADSGFSTNKTYTHLVNFPAASDNVATVNGVRVGDTGTWSWGSAGPGSSRKNATTDTGIGFIVSTARFVYNVKDCSLTISGLTAGKVYDFRFYFNDFSGNANRNVTYTFSRGGATLGSVDWNADYDPERAARRNAFTAVGCRYVADATGEMTVRIVSHHDKDTCHLYGFSNELVGDAGDVAETVSLAPSAGETARLTGGVSGTAPLSLDGAGTQVLGGEIALTAPLAVNAGRLVLESGAAVTAGVAVARGATVEMQGSARVNGLSGAGALELSLGDNDPWGALQADGTFAAPEWPRRVNISGDADSGIAPFKTYTHFVNTGHAADTVQLVNNVPVTCVADKSGIGVTHYDLHRGKTYNGLPQTQMLNDTAARNAPIKMSSANAMWSFYNRFQYAASNSLVLRGLSAGVTYEFRLYVRQWTADGVRWITFNYNDGTEDKTYYFNEDGNLESDDFIALRYKPVNSTFTLKWTADSSGAGLHLYAFSNEEVASHVRVVNNDADLTFSGAISGNGELRKTGAGAWTLTGAGTASGAWAVAEGALVLDGATATTGPVAVAAGASFGGVGSAGGDVGVASGATLRIGADGTVGTLALGGDLAVAAGASITVAHDRLRASALTAAGKVTLPASLTVTAVPTTPGAALAGRTPLITAGTELAGPADLTGWSVVDEDGNAIRGAKLSYGEDGTSVWLVRPVSTVLLFR